MCALVGLRTDAAGLWPLAALLLLFAQQFSLAVPSRSDMEMATAQINKELCKHVVFEL